MLAIPTLKVSYGNLLLARLRGSQRATVEDLLGDDPESLFKSDGPHVNPTRRAHDCLRYARMLGLAADSDGTWELTERGSEYVAALDVGDPWKVGDVQAAVLRECLASGEPSLARDVRTALEVVRGLPGGFSIDDLGREFARQPGNEQWRADRTLNSQGARYRALLSEAGLIDDAGRLTKPGSAFLERRPSVWWVNQGATYAKERDGAFLWAPLRNKANRPQYHWDTMDEVAEGDTALHYSNGFVRAVSRVSRAAQPARNPLGGKEWEESGRLVETQYQELNEPVPLAAISEVSRISQGSPFTVSGAVQQVYLVRLKAGFVSELASRFPEVASHLPGVDPASGGARSRGDLNPAGPYGAFAAAVEVAGLQFASDSNLVRSFISSLLAKPFVILTGLAGSGKTQLAMKLGEWFGTDDHGRPRHVVVPVRPDWTGPESMFGYEDALRSSTNGKPVWFVPEAFEFVLRAVSNPDHPYLLILDEMNLAHVERYFSDFLSGIESRRPVLPDLVLDEPSGLWSAREVDAQKLPLPRNLFVVGTVNVDETTYMFSPKVLDRAFTFEFRVTSGELDPDLRRPVAALPGEDRLLRAFSELAESDDWQSEHPHPDRDSIVAVLREVHAILSPASQEFGHRTLYEILRFCSYYSATGDDDADTAVDLAIMQKVLPKVHGSRRRLEPVLNALSAVAVGVGPQPRFPVTFAKLGRMIDSVRANQFVSFTE